MFVRRSHKTFIKLKPDEEILYRLPPMSQAPDVIIIEANNRYFRKGIGGATVIDGNPTADLELELRHAEHLSVPGTNRITYGFLPGQVILGDDLWRLRVKRINQNSESVIPDQDGRLEYRITAQYPSQLPILERSIPASFFHDGFAENWNQQKYVRVLFTGQRIEISFEKDLAALHDLPPHGNPYVIDTSPLSFEPSIEMIEQQLDIGAGSIPVFGGNAPFFSIRAKFPAVRLELDVTGPNPTVDLPPFYMTIRFYLKALGAPNKILEYVTEVDTNLKPEFGTVVDIIDAFGGPDEKEAVELVKKKIEQGLNKFQRAELSLSKFGDHLTPWLVGGRINPNPSFSVNELVSIGYAPGPGDQLRPNGIVEPATGELVVRYIGPRPKPDPDVLETAENIPTGATDDGSIPLFDLPDENPDPIPGEGPFGIDPVPLGQTPDIGALAKIKHIVVLMQENRSFDQVLGYLSREKIDDKIINPNVEGLFPLDDPRSQQQRNRHNNREFPVRRADKEDPKRAAATAWPSFKTPGPGHDHDDIATQMLDGMGGFVSNFARRVGDDPSLLRLVMDYFGPEDLPVYATLAREFGICDHWYTSHAGPTWPNRFILFTGDLSKDPAGTVEFNNPNLKTMLPLQQPTIFDYLNKMNVQWRLFEHGFSFLRLFANFTYDITNIVPFDDPTRGFMAAARTGTLPPVTLIEPDYIDLPPGNDDHPPADMADGQNLVERILKALIDSPVWESTLFIITYDEHGGFYDHVDPPNDAPPLRGGLRKLGPRVPTFVISPLVKPGTVFHSRFDHTSIGATILRRFAGGILKRPPKVSPRMDAALDLREVLTLDQARPKSDFAGLFTGQPVARAATQDRRAPIGIPDSPAEDFHWLLSAMRLTIGEPPKEGKKPVGPDPCQAEIDRLKAVRAKINAIDNAIESFQELLREASPTQKPGFIRLIRAKQQERLTIANGELAEANNALQACRARQPVE